VIAIGLLGVGPALAWLYLLFGRSGFWRCRERDDAELPDPPRWPSVTAIVPARNEADTIRTCVASLLGQDYRGTFRVIVVDDQSTDRTGELAQSVRSAALMVLTGSERPAGWAGKVWAMHQGLERALADFTRTPEYIWFTDADISHRPDTLARLVARAEAPGGLALVSLMARLSCHTRAEKFLIPAFVYFFQLLYPFATVNNPRSRTAAAAGGCMLARTAALRRAGGLRPIPNAIIDDCALARLLKTQGPIWIGLTNRSVSLRIYDHFADIRRMVTRTAFVQLRCSPVLLLGTLSGLGVIFVAPVFAALFARGIPEFAGLCAWAAMAVSFGPMLRFYGRPAWWGVLVPLIASVYGAFTLESAILYWLGRGGNWKGRIQAARGV
jgi:hopene-associated glycosyltransferase HpnB